MFKFLNSLFKYLLLLALFFQLSFAVFAYPCSCLEEGIDKVNEPIKIVSPGRKKPPGEVSIIINLYSRTLSILFDGKVYKTYPVTIGKRETPTPVGEWLIVNKYQRIDGGPLGSRWMGLNVPWGVYGIHGTNRPWQIGTAASQGCIRLHNEYVEEIFEWVEINTPVKITGPVPEVKIEKILRPGDIGYDVMAVQERLREMGFYASYLNGTYDTVLADAVKELEAQFSLKADGICDENVLKILGLKYYF
ncbi:MAG: L,D-transpeptidase family protein [Halanaerobiaceae bacterium]|nr:L,D-transpeptidase family protein [Halanaerobiaceae bacterium]